MSSMTGTEFGFRFRVEESDMQRNKKRLAALPRPPVPPIEYAGQWIAWNKERTEIVAHAHTLEETHVLATEAGFPDATLMKLPRTNAFIGTL